MLDLLKLMSPLCVIVFVDLPTAPVEDETGPLPYMQEEEGEEIIQDKESS